MKIPIPSGATEVEVTFPAVAPPPNQAPVVNAGSDQSIVLPVDSVQLNGTASDPDGQINTVVWENIDSNGTIENSNQLLTKVTGLKKGTARFRLTALDNNGAASVPDDMSVIVNDAAPTPTPGYQLIFQTEYDKESDIRNSDSQQAGKGIISTEQFVTAPASFLAIPENVSSGIRSEVQYTGSNLNPEEAAAEWSARYKVVVQSNMCSFQVHPMTGGSSGSPYLMHEGGKFTWVVWNRDGSNNYYPTGFTIQKDIWYKMRLEVKFSTNKTGYLRFWINGTKVLDKANINVGDGSGHYWKNGSNGWGSDSLNSRIFYDSFKIFKKI